MDVASGDERGTTERVLTLLGLLQQRQVWTGPELADRLGVTPRTVRRDVERLHTFGYPVHASQGVGGGTSSARGRTCRRCPSTTRRRSPPRSRCSPARVARSPAPATPQSGR
jgi:biotin operon repressor